MTNIHKGLTEQLVNGVIAQGPGARIVHVGKRGFELRGPHEPYRWGDIQIFDFEAATSLREEAISDTETRRLKTGGDYGNLSYDQWVDMELGTLAAGTQESFGFWINMHPRPLTLLREWVERPPGRLPV